MQKIYLCGHSETIQPMRDSRRIMVKFNCPECSRKIKRVGIKGTVKAVSLVIAHVAERKTQRS
jgi:tyrosine-protein phosphatase YwqE